MRVLNAGGLTLEPQIASHAAELYTVLSEPALYRYIDRKAPASEAALAERLARLESRISPKGSAHWLNWVARDPGGVVGYVQATVADHNAEIAYVFVHHVWQGEPDPVDHSLVRAVEKQLRQLPIEVDQSHLESEHSRTAS